MNLRKYFDEKQGIGIIATSDAENNVNQAVYSKPHILNENEIAFIMHEKRTYSNIKKNPKASYLFIENDKGYNGIRLYLKKIREEKNSDLLFLLRRKKSEPDKNKNLFLVIFKIEKQIPLIGTK